MKDWLNLTLSVVALLVSGVVAYLQFRQVDDVRGVIRLHDATVTQRDPEHVELFYQADATFVNSGTRPISVVGTDLLLLQSPEDKGRLGPNRFTLQDCTDAAGGELAKGDMESFVVAPGEIVSRRLTFKLTDVWVTDDWTPGAQVVTCLSLLVIDADGAWRCPRGGALLLSGPPDEPKPDPNASIVLKYGGGFTGEEKPITVMPSAMCRG